MHLYKGLYLHYVNLAWSARQGNKSDTLKKKMCLPNLNRPIRFICFVTVRYCKDFKLLFLTCFYSFCLVKPHVKSLVRPLFVQLHLVHLSLTIIFFFFNTDTILDKPVSRKTNSVRLLLSSYYTVIFCQSWDIVIIYE